MTCLIFGKLFLAFSKKFFPSGVIGSKQFLNGLVVSKKNGFFVSVKSDVPR